MRLDGGRKRRCVDVDLMLGGGLEVEGDEFGGINEVGGKFVC